MKKFIAIAVLPLFLILAACGGQSKDSTHSAAAPSPSASAKLRNIDTLPPSFDGKWAAVDTDKDVNFEAQISDNHIVVNWAPTKDNPSTALYWDGTFPVGSDTGTIVSQGNVKKMSNALLASGSKTKKFTYENGQLVFSFSMMGVTTPVHLKKVT